MEFSELNPQFKALNAKVLGVSPDSVSSHQKFIQKHNLSIDLLSDPDHKIVKSYNAWGKKKMYGKEYEGVIRSTVIIDPDGMVRLIWPKAKAKGHALEVLNELKSIVG
ncbi:MAG: peroxiredoxin [Desulfobacterales bacterium]|nr:MAG: peroxiredoxin [Desulfobacterales bacterium]